MSKNARLILIFRILLRKTTDGTNHQKMDVNIDDKTNNPELWWVFSGYSFVRDMISDY